MTANLPVIIVICPFFAALICPILSFLGKQIAKGFVIAVNAFALCLAVYQLYRVVNFGRISYSMGDWAVPYGIEFSVDALNAVVLVLVFTIGLMSLIFSLPFVEKAQQLRTFGYYSTMSLLICGLAGMSSTGDVFNLYVFLEITSLSGYTLIALGGSRGTLSAFRYLLIGTIGASFYLLGVAFLYGETGSLNMQDIAMRLGPVTDHGTTLIAMAFFVIGFAIKMSLFPLHGWQPAAYASAHPGAAPLISGVMGKIPAYGMIRFFFFLFDANAQYVRQFLVVVGIMSCCGMIYGSLKALEKTDFRKMLAYSSIAQIGYIGLGVAITGYYGLIGAVLHIVGHSAMKSCLFFCAGGIQYKYGEVNMKHFGQLQKTMPFTSAAIVIAGLSMIGIPPLTGFFSKWYLALGAAKEGMYIYIAVLVASSLLNAIYFFRLFERLFMDKENKERRLRREKVRPRAPELPLTMLIPIIVCALMIILLGVFNTGVVDILSTALTEVTP